MRQRGACGEDAPLFCSNQSDEVWDVLRVCLDAQRWLGAKPKGEEPVLHRDHAHIMPGNSKEGGGCVFDPDRKRFALAVKHGGEDNKGGFRLSIGSYPDSLRPRKGPKNENVT